MTRVRGREREIERIRKVVRERRCIEKSKAGVTMRMNLQRV